MFANTPVDVSAGGTFCDIGTTSGILSGLRLIAGSATATLTVKETDTNGRVLAYLSAVTGAADESRIPVSYRGAIFVSITGTGAKALAYQP